MCATCGCGRTEHHHDHGHEHDHEHDHAQDGSHVHRNGPEGQTIRLEQELLAKNDRLAERNRRWLAERSIPALNLMGAPGAGKTALLEHTIARFGRRHPMAVLEGDQDTRCDAERIRRAGCSVVQTNTGAGCHLDAGMVATGIESLAPPMGTLLFIENVGNLVCPALFDLGEHAKVVVMSVTEGEDKALKYPDMFRAADVLVLNKVDLLPHLRFDVQSCVTNARRVNPSLRVFLVSATRGEGVDDWCGFLQSLADDPRGEDR